MRVCDCETNKSILRHFDYVKDVPECSYICMNFLNISAYYMHIQ